ncbi:ferritin [Rhizobium sp. SJZ105]|uniref:ferritin n=1 Tax=Rhizobium sp. SJZ105 TaxID=2572678 RepID=UPI0011A11FE5|nr:ferritin [Rhizobium sp. SJZ105]TWC89425.1 ferritin [Rhizobium sp. SJZ105]
MANKLVETTLNDLLNGELRAHHAYLQAAAWAAERNLDGCYKFLLGHAAEELKHMHRIFSFLNDLGAPVIFTELPAPQVTANDIKGLFAIVAQHESRVTAAINAAVDLARSEKDHATTSFLQWFVNEQHEEDSLCRTIMGKIELISDGPNALYLIDREIGELAEKA